MKTLLSITLLLGIVMSLSAQSAYVKRVKCDSASLAEYEVYHESDDLIGAKDNYIVYLNQTSPERDTIYVIQVVTPKPQCKGTTKSGNQCKLHTSDPSGYCHLHNPNKAVAVKNE